MKLFFIILSMLFLTSCQDNILSLKEGNLNFRAPNAVEEKIAKLNYSYEQQMSDRSYVESVLLQVFDAKGTSAASYIETEIFRKVEFGGACDVYEPSDLGTATIEFSREQCYNGIGVVQGSNNNPMRYSLTTKVCERLVIDKDRMGAVRKKIFSDNKWNRPTSASIQKAWALFFPIHPADPMVVDGLLEVANVSAGNENAWQNIMLTLCISPEWQAI